MLFRDTGRELTVYITNDEEEFLRVEAELVSEGVRYRVWTTSEYPVFGWTRWDPRLMGRRENRLRRVYHIDVAEQDRQVRFWKRMAKTTLSGRLATVSLTAARPR